MKFTEEEISLCKQVAEKHRKPLDYGNWFYDESLEESENPLSLHLEELLNIKDEEFITPLWTISDCLEFLRERLIDNLTIEASLQETHNKAYEVYGYFVTSKTLPNQTGKTPLEACLKAVLAVLEEG